VRRRIFPSGVVATDGFDRRCFRDTTEASPELASVVDRAQAALGDPSGGTLAQDTWADCFKFMPEDVAQPAAGLAAVASLLAELRRYPEWAELRAAASLDEWAAAMAAIGVLPRVLDALPDEVKHASQAAAQAAETAEQTAGHADSLAGLLNEQLPDGAQQDLQQQYQAAEQEAAAAAAVSAAADSAAVQALQQALRQPGRGVRAGLRQAVSDAAEDARLVAGWGLSPGPGGHDPEAARAGLALAAHLVKDQDLRAALRQAGRIFRLGLTKRRQILHSSSGEIYSLELGRDLARVLPAELVLLRHPVLRREFRRRYAEGSLTQYAVRERQTLGQGPVVVCIDTSGSMIEPGPAGLSRLAWAKALGLGMAMLCGRERRAWWSLLFGADANLPREYFWRRGVDPARLEDFMSFGWRGGTSFAAPLARARQIISDSPAFRRADILFVTDGECALPDDFLEDFQSWKAASGVSVFAFGVGDHPGGTAAFADRTWQVTGSDQQPLEEMLEALAGSR